MKIVVLGAGIAGVTTAYYLHKQGYDVTVIDRHDASAMECSHANGGHLSYTHTEPWASMSLMRMVPGWLIQKDCPLLISHMWDPSMWAWVLKLLACCPRKKVLETTQILSPLALYSKKCLHHIIEDTKVEFDHTTKGILHICDNEKSLDKHTKQAQVQEALGFSYHRLDSRQACEKFEPALSQTARDIAGGLVFPLDESGDSCQFIQNLTQFLIENGVTFKHNTTVDTLSHQGDHILSVKTSLGDIQADKFVVALGAYSGVIMRSLGINIPMYPLKGYSITIPVEQTQSMPQVPLMDTDNKIVISPMGNMLRAAGTVDFAGFNHAISDRQTDVIVSIVKGIFPSLSSFETVQKWSCLRPFISDCRPVLGKSPYKNLFMNTGHGSLGWTLGCGSSALVADVVAGNTPELALDGLTYERFG